MSLKSIIRILTLSKIMNFSKKKIIKKRSIILILLILDHLFNESIYNNRLSQNFKT